MRKLAYAIVIIAGLLFISDWAFVNYRSFEAAYAGTSHIPEALAADAGTTDFAQCDGRWRGNQIMIEGCNANARSGMATVGRAWRNPSISSAAKAQIAACWPMSQTQWGTDWMLLGGCAGLYDPSSGN